MSEYVKQLGIFCILGFIGVVGAFALLSPTVQTPVINALSPQWIAGWLLAAGDCTSSSVPTWSRSRK